MWRVEFTLQAEKQFKKLDKQAQQDVVKYLGRVGEDPYAFGKSLMHDLSGLWRYRVGKYRIICKLEEDVLIVHVVAIAKRDKVYN